MNGTFYNTIDILFFSFIILVIIISYSLVCYNNLQLAAKYRMFMAVSILVIVVLDFLSRIEFPFSKSVNHVILYIVNYVYFVLQPLPVCIGMMYFFSLFSEKRFSMRYYFILLLPFIAGCIVMIYSLFTDFVFYIDDNNMYNRGPGVLVYSFANYFYIIPALYVLIKHRDKVKRQILLVIIIYTLIPLVGSLAQLLNYGIITAWPAFTIALLLGFIFLERRKTERDYLTGLLNRQSFDVKAYSRIEQYDKKGSFALIVIDLNKFKFINDEFGHAEGDNVLQDAALILAHSISTSDIIARYGGDEFVILLETANAETVEKIIERIHHNFALWNIKKNLPFSLSLSAGYAIYDPKKHKDFSCLFDNADEMMFKMKEVSHKASL